MNCCRQSNDTSAQNIPFPVSSESKQWLIMMKYMLDCAEKSIEFLDKMKDELDFNDEDLERFSILCIALDQARHQMALLGKKFFEDNSTTDFLENLSILSELKEKTKSGFTQTGQEDHFSTEETNAKGKTVVKDKEPIKKDICLCNVFKQKVVKKSNQNKIVVCSRLKRSSLINETCLRDGPPGVKKKFADPEDYPNDDDHPYIIKDSKALAIPETGFGYELFYAMHRHRNKIAQIVEITDDSQTFEELLQDTISTAVNMKKKGLDEDSLVCICVTNTKYACMPYIAGLFIGCKLSALDLSFNHDDLVFLLKLSTPDIMFVQNEKVSMIDAALQEIELDIPVVVIGDEVEGHEHFQEYLVASDEERKKFRPYKVDSMRRTCVILFSSGTSGLPKAICLNHSTVLGQAFFTTITDDPQKIFISYTSYYWISAVVLLGYTTLAGVARVVPKPFDATRFFELIERYKVESAFLGPYECVMVLKTPKPPGVDTSSLARLLTGGASSREIVLLSLRRVFPGCMVFQGYGQTEVGGFVVKWSTVNPEDLALLNVRPLSSGRPFGGFWYKVVDEETDKILGPNKPGQLYLKSDTLLMNGYYRRDSSECFDRSGWLKTGDLVYYDDYHCFYVLDRVKELIKYRGWHIPPNILEEALMTHPAVARAVVVGIPHPEDGEHPMGLIIPKDGIDPDTIDLDKIAEYVNRRVDERKQLRGGVRIIHTIPLTATGKIRRRSLRDSVMNQDIM